MPLAALSWVRVVPRTPEPESKQAEMGQVMQGAGGCRTVESDHKRKFQKAAAGDPPPEPCRAWARRPVILTKREYSMASRAWHAGSA